MKKIEPIKRIENAPFTTTEGKINQLVEAVNTLQEQVEGISIQLDLLKGSMSEKVIKTTSSGSVPTPTPVEEKDRMAKYVQTIRAINSTPPLQEQGDWEKEFEKIAKFIFWEKDPIYGPENHQNKMRVLQFISTLLTQREEAVGARIIEKTHEVLRNYCVIQNTIECRCSEIYDKIDQLQGGGNE